MFEMMIYTLWILNTITMVSGISRNPIIMDTNCIQPYNKPTHCIAIEDRHYGASGIGQIKQKFNKYLTKRTDRYGVVLVNKKKCPPPIQWNNTLSLQQRLKKPSKYQCQFQSKQLQDSNTSIYWTQFVYAQDAHLILCAEWSLTHKTRFVRAFSDTIVITGNSKNQLHAECHWQTHSENDIFTISYQGMRNTKWIITDHDTTGTPRIKAGVLMVDKRQESEAGGIMKKIIAKKLAKNALIAAGTIGTIAIISSSHLIATIITIRTIKEGVQVLTADANKANNMAQAKLVKHVNILDTDLSLDRSTGVLALDEIACITIIDKAAISNDNETTSNLIHDQISATPSNKTKCVGIKDRSKKLKDRLLRQQAYALQAEEPSSCKHSQKSGVDCKFKYEAYLEPGRNESDIQISVRIYSTVQKEKVYLCSIPYGNGQTRYVELRREMNMELEDPINCVWNMVENNNGDYNDNSAFIFWKHDSTKINGGDAWTISSKDSKHTIDKPRILMDKNGKRDTVALTKTYMKTAAITTAAGGVVVGAGIASFAFLGAPAIAAGVGAGFIASESKEIDKALTKAEGQQIFERRRRLKMDETEERSNAFNGFLGPTAIIVTTVITLVVIIVSIFISMYVRTS